MGVGSAGAALRAIGPGYSPPARAAASIGIIERLECLVRKGDPAFGHFPVVPRLVGHRFAYPIDTAILDRFVARQVLTRDVFDRVLLCPECHAIPTVRPGCPSCGSMNLCRDELVHHFSCGHVAHLDHFLQPDGSLRCRKCQKTNLIINADYDLTGAMCRCSDCGWMGGHPRLVGRCQACSLAFLISEAHEQELWEYRVR